MADDTEKKTCESCRFWGWQDKDKLYKYPLNPDYADCYKFEAISDDLFVEEINQKMLDGIPAIIDLDSSHHSATFVPRKDFYCSAWEKLEAQNEQTGPIIFERDKDGFIGECR